MQVDLRPRSVGEQLSLIGSLTAALLPKLIVLLLVLQLPGLVLQAWTASMPVAAEGEFSRLTGGAAGWLYMMVIGPVSTGASVALIAGCFTGRPISLGESVVRALRNFFGVVGVSLATGLVVMLGFILLIVPGLIFAAWFSTAVCVLMVEQRGVGHAMSRSRELARGRVGSILGVLIVLYLILGAGTAAVTTVLGVAEGASFGMSLLAGVISNLFTILLVVAPVVIYFDLRVRKDALDVETLAELVDDIGRRRGAQGQPAR